MKIWTSLTNIHGSLSWLEFNEISLRRLVRTKDGWKYEIVKLLCKYLVNKYRYQPGIKRLWLLRGHAIGFELDCFAIYGTLKLFLTGFGSQ